MTTIHTAAEVRATMPELFVPTSIRDEDKIELTEGGCGRRVSSHYPPSREAVALASLDHDAQQRVASSVLGFLIGTISAREQIGASPRELLQAELASDALWVGMQIEATRQMHAKAEAVA